MKDKVLFLGPSPSMRHAFIQAMANANTIVICRITEALQLEEDQELKILDSLNEHFVQKINFIIQECDTLLLTEPIIRTCPPQNNYAHIKRRATKPKAVGSPHLYIARARSWL